MKRKIFLLYPYYWPLYKAGGPVQSLHNLVSIFKDQAVFYLVSLDKDIDGSVPLEPLHTNEWSVGQNNENVYYTSFLSPFLLARLIYKIKPDVIMINGMFHWHTTLFGLLFGKMRRNKIIISPRGMLQDWALKRGATKKLVFLSIVKLLLKADEVWHATDELEKADILRHFGEAQQVHIASNIPRPVGEIFSIPIPNPAGKITIVFLSLINPNKNLHLIIDSVNQLGGKFIVDIYGPIIDSDYWQLCRGKIRDESIVCYKGSVPPWEVPKILQGYHFFVLPTQGENFGHAIFDALASGVPVVISDRTPWKGLDSFNAGFYINLDDSESLLNTLKTISFLSQEQYQKYRTQSIGYAKNYLAGKDYFKEYNFLIGSPSLSS